MGADEFMKTKVDLAVAASRLIGTRGSTSSSGASGSSSAPRTKRVFAPLLISLAALKKHAADATLSTPSSGLKSSYAAKVDEVLNHVIQLLEDSSKLEMNVKDPEMMQELYLSIASSFSGSPELRVTWMENLSQLHAENEDYEEAAQCRVSIASMVAQYVKSREGCFGPMTRLLPPHWHHFPFLAPNLQHSPDPPLSVAQYPNMESSTWTSKYLLEMLRTSAALFDKATRYELSLEVYNNIRMYQKMEKKWDAYQNTIKDEQELLGRLVDVNKPVERIFPVYFRVAFYGSKWEHLDGKQFIYKKSPKFSLSTFKKQLEEQYKARVAQKQALLLQGDDANPADMVPSDANSTSNRERSGTTTDSAMTATAASGGSSASTSNPSFTSLTYNANDATAPADLVIMSTNEAVKRETLDASKAYIQMTGVQPYFESEEADTRIARTDQHFAINKFLFETAFAEDGGTGKELEDMSKLCKKKTVFITTHAFPYLKTRLEITDTKEITLNPIENAIEVIKQQIVKVRGELETVPTRLKSLQQVIQGSVVPMVNPGPLKICEIFLTEKAFLSKKYPHKDLKMLCNAMNAFVKLCAFAIKLNKANIDASHAKFQAMVEQYHGELEKIVKACTSTIEKLLEAIPA